MDLLIMDFRVMILLAPSHIHTLDGAIQAVKRICEDSPVKLASDDTTRYECMYVFIYAYFYYVCISVCMYVCMYVCTYVSFV